MADEPSIDEILASLDQLLKEGEGRNDEPESAPTPDDGDTSSPVPHDAPTPHFFEVLDDEAEPARAAAETDAERGDMLTPETDAASGQDAESRLFVLTEDMRIDEPSLPLGLDDVEDEPGAADDGTGQGTDPGMDAMHQELELPVSEAQESAEAWDSDDADTSESESEGLQEAALRVPEILPVTEPEPEPEPEPLAGGEPEPEPGARMASDTGVLEDGPAESTPVEGPWDETEIQALVDQVTDDVCSAVAEQLPEMIRTALAERLAAFIDARKNHEDTGTQE